MMVTKLAQSTAPFPLGQDICPILPWLVRVLQILILGSLGFRNCHRQSPILRICIYAGGPSSNGRRFGIFGALYI
jgi:hypothetical protein